MQADEFHAELNAAGYCELTDNDLDALRLALADGAEAERARELLDAAGYWEVTATDLEALEVALRDATEALRAREVIAVNEDRFDDDPAGRGRTARCRTPTSRVLTENRLMAPSPTSGSLL